MNTLNVGGASNIPLRRRAAAKGSVAVRGRKQPSWCKECGLDDPDHEEDCSQAPPRERIRCDQCEMLSINGLACHETGCPNQRKTWVPDRGWVRFSKCFECGCGVELGESCDCQEPPDFGQIAA
jgi:hypothetical protein